MASFPILPDSRLSGPSPEGLRKPPLRKGRSGEKWAIYQPVPCLLPYLSRIPPVDCVKEAAVETRGPEAPPGQTVSHPSELLNSRPSPLHPEETEAASSVLTTALAVMEASVDRRWRRVLRGKMYSLCTDCLWDKLIPKSFHRSKANHAVRLMSVASWSCVLLFSV